MKPKEIFDLIKQAFSNWLDDNAPTHGAALAYYSFFSMAPLLIIAIAVAGMVFGRQAAEGQIVAQIKDTIGDRSAAAVEDLIRNASNPTASTVATLVGIATLLFGASGAFIQLQDSLNTIWKVKPKPGRGLVNFIRDRLLSFAMVLGIGFLLLVSLLLSTALTAVSNFLSSTWLPGGEWAWTILNGVLSLVVITLLFAMIYKVLPDVTLAWKDVWIGAIVTAVLFTLGKYLIGLYLGRAGVASPFGAAGSLVLVLVWVYYSSQIVLLGAEFTRVCALKCGMKVTPMENAEFITPEPRTGPERWEGREVAVATRSS
jgi:membrane protein